MTFDPDALWIDPLPHRPILPTLSLGLEEIFVTSPEALGDFMPILEVRFIRRGVTHPPSVFSLN